MHMVFLFAAHLEQWLKMRIIQQLTQAIVSGAIVSGAIVSGAIVSSSRRRTTAVGTHPSTAVSTCCAVLQALSQDFLIWQALSHYLL